jgi:hypothetical protein
MRLAKWAFVMVFFLNGVAYAEGGWNRREFIFSCAAGLSGLALVRLPVIAKQIPPLSFSQEVLSHSQELLAAGYFGRASIREQFSRFMDEPQHELQSLILTGTSGSGKTYLIDRASQVWGFGGQHEDYSSRFLTLHRVPNEFVVTGDYAVSDKALIDDLNTFLQRVQADKEPNGKIMIFFEHLHKIPAPDRLVLMRQIEERILNLPPSMRGRVRLVYAYLQFEAPTISLPIGTERTSILKTF